MDNLEVALWTMAYIGAAWLIAMVGGLAAEAAHDAGINPFWPADTCPPPPIYPDMDAGILWVHGTSCDGVEFGPRGGYTFTATGCRLGIATPNFRGTPIFVLGQTGQPCHVTLASHGQLLGAWDFTSFYTGPTRGVPGL